jgi:glucuronosyltransferase
MRAVLFLFTLVLFNVDAAKILGVFPYPSKSHTILGQALFAELAGRGHETTFVTPYPLKNPPTENYREVVITSREVFEVFEDEATSQYKNSSNRTRSLIFAS